MNTSGCDESSSSQLSSWSLFASEEEERIRKLVHDQLIKANGYLDLRDMGIRDSHVRVIVKEIIQNNHSSNNKNKIKSLHLGANDIGNEGCRYLSEFLEAKDTTLEYLDLTKNNIDNEGVSYLAKGLETNTTLTDLDLFYNHIGNEGCIALAKLLTLNTSLKMLNLEYNHRIDKTGAAVLATALEDANTSITSLYTYNDEHFDNPEGRSLDNKIYFFRLLNECGRQSFQHPLNNNNVHEELFENFLQFYNQVSTQCGFDQYKVSCFYYCLRLRPEIVVSSSCC